MECKNCRYLYQSTKTQSCHVCTDKNKYKACLDNKCRNCIYKNSRVTDKGCYICEYHNQFKAKESKQSIVSETKYIECFNAHLAFDYSTIFDKDIGGLF